MRALSASAASCDLDFLDLLQQPLDFAITMPPSRNGVTMKTYVARIGGKAVLAFRAQDDDEARAIIDDEEGSMRSDLKVPVGMDGKPLWDGELPPRRERRRRHTCRMETVSRPSN